jgi:hypothetical protein
LHGAARKHQRERFGEAPGRGEAQDPELPEPEATRSGTSVDAFDEFLRHADEARTERPDHED